MDYTDFRFGNYYTKDLHLVVVSSSDRYTKNLLPEPTDYTEEVPGGDGTYYFGQLYKDREIDCNVAFDSISEKDFRKISQIFSTDKPQDLVFDELPYKTYKAKLKSKPEFNYICFRDKDTGERVYKGEGTLNFICYFPYAYCFNKYIVRAADYYLKTPPEKVIKESAIFENPYEKKKQIIYNKHTKDYYNVENNMETPWKGGYPTIQQVQAGELYFNTPDGEKSIIDVRRYWNNIPLWQNTAKLLTTPTLDYDQELIYMPQYSKLDYYNMDTGFNQANALIGSRLLVYNPGDLPVDFEIKLDNNERTFWMSRGNHFQVRRFNVQRLTIPEAVDWTGLKTCETKENKDFKYGKRYFKKLKLELNEDDGSSTYEYIPIGNHHPKHAYIVEPIPKERLGHFIKLFYWQSSLLTGDNGAPMLNFEDGIKLADRYDELYNLCITDEEKNELYWKTLKEAILNQYGKLKVFKDDTSYTLDDFIYGYIHNPPEYIRKNKDLYYGQFDFNLNVMPQYLTEDYFEITTDDITKPTLYLDTDKRMLYNVNNPEFNISKKETLSNFYNYKPTKNIYNENIKQGHWFKIPPGWSMIEVTPVCDEDIWGGKRWLDARPFDWGYGGENGKQKDIQSVFNKVYEMAAKSYLIQIGKLGESDTMTDYIELLNFRHIFDSQISAAEGNDNFAFELYKTREQNLEYGLLKTIHAFWRAAAKVETWNKMGCTGKIEEWWWYACNYLWEHFPPLYWGYADILNKAQIKYTPLFY